MATTVTLQQYAQAAIETAGVRFRPEVVAHAIKVHQAVAVQIPRDDRIDRCDLRCPGQLLKHERAVLLLHVDAAGELGGSESANRREAVTGEQIGDLSFRVRL